MADIVFEDSTVNVDSVPFHSDPDEQTSAVHALRSTGGLSLQNLSIQTSDERPESGLSGGSYNATQSISPGSPSHQPSPHRTPSPCPSQPPSRQCSIHRSPTPFSSPSPRPSPALGLQHAVPRSPTPFPLQNLSPEQTPAASPHFGDSDMVCMSEQRSANEPAVPPGPTHTSVTDRQTSTPSTTSLAADSRPLVSAQGGVFPPVNPSQVSVMNSPQAPNRRQKKMRGQDKALTLPAKSSTLPDTPPSTVPTKRQLKPSGRTEDKLAKKIRTASTTTKGSAPAWFEQSKDLFRSEGLGGEWLQLLGAWERFEVQEGYKEQGKLSSKGRPDVVQMWISRARSTSWRPLILDTGAYGVTFNSWWAQLQPQWRVSGDGAVDSQLLEGNWDCLRRPGLNGLQSVVAALFYWGIAAKKAGACKSWLSAVLECLSVFCCLHKS